MNSEKHPAQVRDNENWEKFPDELPKSMRSSFLLPPNVTYL